MTSQARTLALAAVLAAVLILAALAGGYWLGQRGPHADATGPAAAPSTATAERKILYYRNPMGLADTSPVPKKDSMGMDYIPVYAGEEPAEAGSGIRISTEKVQKLGVRTEAAALRVLDRSVRAAGRVEPDERRTYTVAPKFEGFVERLHVNATGQAVGRGQVLFEAYSPELVSAQREYAIAMQGLESLKDADADAQRGMRQLAEASLARLRNWDVSEAQVKALSGSREARRTLEFRSPVAGIVAEKKAVQGMRFMPGEMLYQISDLSSVWVVADVFEQDIGALRPGTKASVRVAAYPDKRFEGTVSYVYPTLNAATRTVPVRIELRNPQLLLKPAMFAEVELATGAAQPVLTVPTSAVIDSGTRAVVLVQTGEGRFEPREVQLGARGDQYVAVTKGVKEGEQVVVAANFLIDAESNLQAALGSFGPAATSAPQAAKAAVGHTGEGQVDSIDTADNSMMVTHAPIASLNWPAMTMEFKLANPSLARGVKPGQKITFEIVERQAGEWVITRLAPLPGAAPTPAAPRTAPAPHQHSGH